MDRTSFVQLIDHIENWWGPSAAWAYPEMLYDGFAAVDQDAALEILRMRATDPDLAKFAPKPAELLAAASRLGAEQGRVLTAPCDHAYEGRWLAAGATTCPRCGTHVDFPDYPQAGEGRAEGH